MAVLLGLGLLLVLLLPLVYGLHYIIVLTGSMTPALPVGSVAVVAEIPAEGVLVGDVVTYQHPDKPTALVTHRVIELTKLENGAPAFRTQGDANEQPDKYLVPAELVWGRVLLTVPNVGYIRDFVRTLPGFLLLSLFPASLLIVNEMVSLRRAYDHRYQALQRRRRHRRR